MIDARKIEYSMVVERNGGAVRWRGTRHHASATRAQIELTAQLFQHVILRAQHVQRVLATAEAGEGHGSEVLPPMPEAIANGARLHGTGRDWLTSARVPCSRSTSFLSELVGTRERDNEDEKR